MRVFTPPRNFTYAL